MDLTVRLRDFGPFKDSGEFTLKPGPNAFVGLNNAGKTALLHALAALQSGPLESKVDVWRHAPSLPESISAYAAGHDAASVEVACAPGNEAAQGLRSAIMRVAQGTIPEVHSVVFDLRWERRAIVIARMLLIDANRERYLLVGDADGGGSAGPIFGASWPPEILKALGLTKTECGAIAKSADALTSLGFPPAILKAQLILPQRRVPEPRTPGVAQDFRQEPNVENLVQILHTLNVGTPADRRTFQKIERELRAFFPEIDSIVPRNFRPSGHNQDLLTLEVDVRGRTIPMGATGTGVWQVLSIITLSLTNEEPTLLLIDEPSAFLHPSAQRRLATLMCGFGKDHGHMFAVATHSYILANHCGESLWGVANREGGARVRSLGAYREAATELGVAPADILPNDAAIYVEGRSDAEVVERLLGFDGQARIAVLPLWGVDRARSGEDLIKRFAALADSLVPLEIPILALLDRDDRSADEVARIEGHARIKFLAKREMENYFLHPRAIAQALSLTPAQAAALSTSLAGSDQTGKGSELLKSALWNAGKIPYDKVKHLPAILEAILSTDRNFLSPLRAELADATGRLSAAPRSSQTAEPRAND